MKGIPIAIVTIIVIKPVFSLVCSIDKTGTSGGDVGESGIEGDGEKIDGGGGIEIEGGFTIGGGRRRENGG